MKDTLKPKGLKPKAFEKKPPGVATKSMPKLKGGMAMKGAAPPFGKAPAKPVAKKKMK